MYDPFYEYYNIEYEDGDQEEFTIEEVTEHLLEKERIMTVTKYINLTQFVRGLNFISTGGINIQM